MLAQRATCACASGSAAASMDHLARNADGDELLFVHQGAGDLYCDYGHLALARRRLRRHSARHDVAHRDTRAARRAARSRRPTPATRCRTRGSLGSHAIFDPAMLDVPQMDDAFRRAAERRSRLAGARSSAATRSRSSPIRSTRSTRSAGTATCRRCASTVRDIRPIVSHRYHLPPSAHTTFVAQPLRRLHVRAAAVRDRSGRAQGAVLPQQRRLRRSDLLSRRRLLLAATTSSPA